MPDRLDRHDFESLRRSARATRQLTQAQGFILLAELEAVLAERDELAGILGRMSAGPWPEVREALTAMHRLLSPRE